MVQISEHGFGYITVNGKTYEYDVIIRIDGSIEKRNKKLSKQLFGNSHKFSAAEAQHAWEEGAENIVIGTGHFGELRLMEEAHKFFDEKNIDVYALNTKKAVVKFKELEGKTIGLFHITC